MTQAERVAVTRAHTAATFERAAELSEQHAARDQRNERHLSARIDPSRSEFEQQCPSPQDLVDEKTCHVDAITFSAALRKGSTSPSW